jgi:hypothetical protein
MRAAEGERGKARRARSVRRRQLRRAHFFRGTLLKEQAALVVDEEDRKRPMEHWPARVQVRVHL